MPVRKRPGKRCWKVEGTNTEKCLTEREAERQLRAIEANKRRKRKRK